MKKGIKKAVLPQVVENKHQLEVNGLYAILIGYRQPGFNFSGEYHASWEMVYVLEGNVEVSADDRIYKLCCGDLILHKPMEYHTIRTLGEKPAKIMIITFALDGGLSHELKNAVFHPSGNALQHLNLLMDTLEANGSMQSSLDSRDYLVSLTKDAPKQLVFRQLEAFLLMLIYSEKGVEATVKNESAELYGRIVEILEENIYGSITIDEIAAKCNLSASTIKKCFSTYTGCGIHKYMLKIKMRAAIKMLHDGMTVNQVSDALGFGDANYFSTVFKREVGRKASSYK